MKLSKYRVILGKFSWLVEDTSEESAMRRVLHSLSDSKTFTERQHCSPHTPTVQEVNHDILGREVPVGGPENERAIRALLAHLASNELDPEYSAKVQARIDSTNEQEQLIIKHNSRVLETTQLEIKP